MAIAVRSVGQGVSELRIHQCPGCRVYFRQRGAKITVLLCSGDKGSLQLDVATALNLANQWEEGPWLRNSLPSTRPST